MSATLRRPAAWVLAVVLTIWAFEGLRCGDDYYSARVAHSQGVHR